MSKQYFSYLRVSTVRQGQTGTSLEEQRAAIARYAARTGLTLSQEFIEQETAAKAGRPLFLRLLQALRQGQAAGVIIHKIDRSARNLKDWAELGELIDRGLEVHFANEPLDLYSRGGRLSADIQAVVAADYIRNLREEVKKGFYGRLNQGLYPMPAPPGYRDSGSGKPKELDPVQAPLVRELFTLYATGRWSILALVKAMKARGLLNRYGAPLTRNGIAQVLHNPFYIGLIRITKTGATYQGVHIPLIPASLFARVQEIAAGKRVPRHVQHDFRWRKRLQCAGCRNCLIGELQKGNLYYRCQTRACPQKTIRSEQLEAQFRAVLEALCFTPTELARLQKALGKSAEEAQRTAATQQQALTLQLEQARVRRSRLTDLYLDHQIEVSLYHEKQASLLQTEQAVQEKLAHLTQAKQGAIQQTAQFLELVNQAYLSYENGNEAEKRAMIEIVTSNCQVAEKKLIVTLHLPFQLVQERHTAWDGGPQRAVHRTFSPLLEKLLEYFSTNELPSYLSPKQKGTSEELR